ncbi:hypothetical protein TREMEDRAFT_69025 [Tremella mesenterica DSM 1558]|uniref:uncharacterized protein n=1 Tax=Tremella mesenterica (strain ATCC 24925 / CBS 8224 / DSM 1558 / NBRC 9311 / NRRL Y-6157 / RJB 2259-6 / UBC 559-6) TaxID=578456 RepID=UPI0003F4A28D|nr:uncharacterized protein TREMEDRAFT_69025 [Tremella mesenterica DSM 1558]EIW69197.1 hypothetical protein TREMEDRAFT_69025 [Tremella mesenterica DSM 1558]
MFDITHLIRHPLFLATYIVAIPAWIVAFAGQCATEAKYSLRGTNQPVCGVLWFAIWVQLSVFLPSFALCSDNLALHRIQLAVILAIAIVFAVIGVNDFIYSSLGAETAVGAGWLLITFADLIWLLYLTSEEDSAFYRILNSAGNGGLSGPNRRARHESTFGHEAGVTPPGNGFSNGGGYPMGGYANAASMDTPQKAAPLAREYTPPASEERAQAFPLRAKALYAYTASADDPNEVTLARGDILEVMDNTGKWWQVKTPAGQTGIAPSNYLQMF